jgi:hypothetical protein
LPLGLFNDAMLTGKVIVGFEVFTAVVMKMILFGKVIE